MKTVKDQQCPQCSKMFSRKGLQGHIWRVHTEEGRNFKPNDGTTIWNRGLTKESDERINAKAQIRRQKLASGEVKKNFLGKSHTKEVKEKLRPNGGPRSSGGRGKQGWYKGIWCDSSWELAYVIYCLDHDMDITRNKNSFEYKFEGKTLRYFPDFVVNGHYTEIKGYETPQWLAKKEQFPYTLNVITKLEIQPIILYVKDKYGKNFTRLYGTMVEWPIALLC